MTPEYLITATIVVLIPGTGVLFTLAVGLGRGWWASVLAATQFCRGIRIAGRTARIRGALSSPDWMIVVGFHIPAVHRGDDHG